MSASPPVILAIAGSLRQGSYNAALLRTAIELAPDSVRIEEASIRGVPLYDGDLEAASGIPPAVQELKDKLANAAGLLLVTPEYNNSIPGVLKNAIDWMSRPDTDIKRVFGDKLVAIMGASPSRFGTVLSQQAWLPVLRTLGMRLWAGPRVIVSGANKAFVDGKLVDDSIRTIVQKFVTGLAEVVVNDQK